MRIVAQHLAVLLVTQTTGSLLVAAESPQKRIQVTLSTADFAYYQQSKPIIASILSGDLASADSGLLILAELDQPNALVSADVHATVGIAYGESGYFEPAIAHIQQALSRENDDIPDGLVSESLAYLVYYHAALSRFAEANRLLLSIDTPPPWLFAKLAGLYVSLDHVCATANAEASLRLAKAGGPLVSHWASRHGRPPDDRDGLIRRLSARLEALRRQVDSPARADTPCVGP